MLKSALAVVSEFGYGEMSVSRVAAGAGVSRRTFYDVFEDREDCFLAVLDGTVARARAAMLQGWVGQEGWEAQVRAGLIGFLLFLDSEPGVGSLLVVEALRAGSRVQERRAELLTELGQVLHRTGSQARHNANAGARGGVGELPELTGEGVTGAVLGVIHTRLLSKRPGRMLSLLNPLMGVIVLAYLGPEAAQAELARPVPSVARPRARSGEAASSRGEDALVDLRMRVTYRTLLVLAVVAGEPGASNRRIAEGAGVADQGQISKLLARLEGLGLVENTAPGQPSGEPNQWRLTAQGERVEQALKTSSNQPQEQTHVL